MHSDLKVLFKRVMEFKTPKGENIKINPNSLLIKRLVEMTGMEFAPKFMETLQNDTKLFESRVVFMETDLQGLGERVKQLDVVSNSKGFVFSCRGNEKERIGDFSSALHLYKLSIQSYEKALQSSPNDVNLLRNCAQVLRKIEKLELALKEGQKNWTKVKISKNSINILTALSYLVRAIKADPNDTSSIITYAKFLEELEELDLAEQHFLHALSINPNDLNSLYLYGRFLEDTRGLHSLAMEFYERHQRVFKKKEQKVQTISNKN